MVVYNRVCVCLRICWRLVFPTERQRIVGDRTGKTFQHALRFSLFVTVPIRNKLYTLLASCLSVFCLHRSFRLDQHHVVVRMCTQGGRQRRLEVKERLASEGIMVRHYAKPASISGCTACPSGNHSKLTHWPSVGEILKGVHLFLLECLSKIKMLQLSVSDIFYTGR